MSSSMCEEIAEVLGGLEACAERLCELTFEAPDTAGLLGIIDAMSRVVRTLRVPGHAVINQLDTRATNAELGGSLGQALADRLRITKTDAHRLIAEAADLGPRRALTGQPLTPVLPATAAAQRRGHLSDANLTVIRKFFAKLPDTVDAATRAYAEDKLALAATGFRPDELSEYAQVLKDCLKPDGDFSPDEPEPTRTRGITLGRQQPDGMSQIRGLITPELRATLEPVIAKLAAPGMCNPDDPTPVIDGRAPAEAVDRDTRTPAQRTHDALQTALRTLLKSGKLGQHHGLPTTIIITTTLAELEAGAGRALTAGGTLLPMSDVLRLASPAHHYLTIFHKDKTLALYHGKRLANPEQRLALLGRDRGCTRPGCTVPGYWTQAHHLEGWMNTRRTHIDELGLACPPDNRLVELHKYTTRRNINGIVEWRPPKHLDVGRPRTNCMHHPERPLASDEDDEAP